MMTREQANEELRRVSKVKGAILQLRGPEVVNRPRPEIPEWLPPGVYEFGWMLPKEDGTYQPELSGKVVIEPEPEEVAETTSGLSFMSDGTLPPGIAQMFQLSQQIADIRASAKDDFYKSMIDMVQQNNATLNAERAKMREELMDERKQWLKMHAEVARTNVSVEAPETNVVDTVKEILSMPQVQPLVQLLLQKGITRLAGLEINPLQTEGAP